MKKEYLRLEKSLTTFNDSYDLNVAWKTKKIWSFFPLKDKNLHPSCKIYYGLCSCREESCGEHFYTL